MQPLYVVLVNLIPIRLHANSANVLQAAENPNSTLSSNEPIEFASRYSDPNHPVVNGSILSLITGGNIDPKSHRESRRSQRGPSRRERHGHAPGDQNDERRQRPLRRFLHHVRYV
jgi:hypothetical protein